MNDSLLHQELDRLRARVATLEQLLDVRERTVLDQSVQLDQSQTELQSRTREQVVSEEARRSQSLVIQLILDSVADGVVVANEHGEFLLFNPAAEQILKIGALDTRPEHWTRDYGLFLPDLITPYPPEQLPLARAIRGESLNSAEVIVHRPEQPQPIWLSVNARPLRDETGRLRGGVAVFRNISARKRAERRGAAQLAVTQVLAESLSLASATPRILEAVCTNVGWDLGTIWYVDSEAQVLRCVDLWPVGVAAFGEFETRTRSEPFTPGVGLPGRVWASGRACWIPDVLRDDNFPRSRVAERAGLHGAVAFPILFDHQVIGVIEFFSREVRPPDQDFLTMLGGLGSQIGQFIQRKRAEEEARFNQERFQLAVLGSRDGLWDWDLQTNQVYHSPRWKSMLGIDEAEPVEAFTEWEHRLHPEDRFKAIAAIQAYFAGEAPHFEVEYRLRHNDGSYRWILDRGVAQFDPHSGEPYRMAGSNTDITERKQMEQELRDAEALYHSLVETLPLAIFRKDVHGRYTFCNQRFCATLERSREEILDQTDFDLCPPELAERFRAVDRQALETGEVVEVIDEHRRSDGEQTFVHILKSRVYDAEGHVIGVQGMFWDVTAHQKAKLELERAKEAAETANRAKSEFLANVSHEIRTPMNGIIGMTELTLDTDLTLVQREYLGLVKVSAEALLAVINDILDYSKMEAGKIDLDLQPFELRDTLGDTLRTLAARAHKKGLELACQLGADVPDHLIGDSVRLRQIVINLVGNAIKFTEKGEVVVRVALEEPVNAGEAHLHVTVRDTGIGIPAAKHAVIFNAFEQADGSTTRRYGGTGLGLTIAARLVDLMCGRLWVESEAGHGSTFHFTAVFGLQPEPVVPRGPVLPVDLRDIPVLIVDDNATNRFILEETLRAWRMKPVTADSGRVALRLLEQARDRGAPFALVLLDAQMPEMDGFSLAERIQQRPDLAGATLMMLTSGGQPGDVSRCRQLGIVSCLLKPVKQSDLLDGIVAVVGQPVVAAVAAPEVPAAFEKTARPLLLLVAEDSPVNQRVMLEVLRKRGHTVVLAVNGREAVELAGRQSFDVILMDVQMPEMDGFEATAALRGREQATGRHVPIIAMTAHAMKGDRERCLAAGMDSYISKPIEVAELFRVLEGLFPANHVPASPANGPPAEINWQKALACVGGDEEILVSVIAAFLEEWPRWRQELRQAVALRDAAGVRRTAHTIKGSLLTLGAAAACETAQRLETLGRSGNLAEVEPSLSQLDQEVVALHPAFTARVRGVASH